MSLFQRLLSYVANEVIVKQLANSQTFQRLALRWHLNIKNAQERGKDALKDISVNDIKSKASEATERASGFFATFRQNYQQELEAMKQAEKSSGKRS